MSSDGISQSSDRPLMDLIRRQGPVSVELLADYMNVTPTAIRVRLSRLVESGLVERVQESVGRGRPKFLYRASTLAQKKLGQNYADLALALWEEVINTVGDTKIRRELFTRITDRLAESYSAQMRGEEWSSRLVQLGGLLLERGVETEISADDSGQTVLKQLSCPYYELAEVDRDICALERRMFEKVVGHELTLSHCRLDGDRSCDFKPESDQNSKKSMTA
ncbi:MAG: hypothetical protein RJA81_1160 [Planctomycetota bacterium]